MNSFVFIGFQPVRTAKRRLLLESLRNEKRTMIFYESPRRIKGLLKDLRDVLGNRTAVFARELTKVFEEIRRGSLDEIIGSLEGRELKGEVTLVVAGREAGDDAVGGEKIRALFEELSMGGENLSTKEMVGEIASATGLPKKEVYRELLKLLEERR
jgi:16S rRNA (cytidine1402-2'-O)-methyltransferase